MNEKNRRIWRYVLRAALTLSTLLFIGWIFSNSLKNASESSAQSSTVRKFLQNLLDAVFAEHAPQISGHFIRKAAHFSEYALLGFLLFFTCLSYTRRRKFFIIPLAAAIVVPFCDEGLQFIPEGRSPQFSDVGIDISGALCGFLFALFLFWIVLKIVRRRRRHA